jgi:RND family efflux transporter MFP subunit
MHNYRTLLSLVFLAIVAWGCNFTNAKVADSEKAKTEDKMKPDQSDIIIPVQAALPQRGPISLYFETTARVEAEDHVQVMAEAIGECEKVLVEEGDRVKAGDILMELDTKTIQATIGQAEVQVRQTKTAYDIAERSLAEGIGAKAERDNAQFAHEQALAALNMQKVQLAKLTVRAPITGIVTKKNVQAGQLVASAAPVFTIVDPKTYMLVINPPEKEIARLKVGQVARVTIDALGNEEFEAKVRRINPSVDPGSGTVKVTLDFDAAIRAQLRESAFARVRLVLDTHENALLVAKDTLVEENARKYVFTVQQKTEEGAGKATASDLPKEAGALAASTDAAAPEKPDFIANRVEVQIGLEDSNAVEILSGIDDTALTVTLGQQTLKTGAKVTVTNASAEILAKAGLSAEEALQAAKEKRSREDQQGGLRVQQGQHRH